MVLSNVIYLYLYFTVVLRSLIADIIYSNDKVLLYGIQITS